MEPNPTTTADDVVMTLVNLALTDQRHKQNRMFKELNDDVGGLTDMIWLWVATHCLLIERAGGMRTDDLDAHEARLKLLIRDKILDFADVQSAKAKQKIIGSYERERVEAWKS